MWRAIAILLLLLALLAGVLWALAGRSRSPHAEFRSRAEREFPEATFLKPGKIHTEGLEADLAPLLMIEKAADAEPPQFGVPSEETEGGIRVVPARPTVYARTSGAHLRGEERPQFTYLWWWRTPAPQGEVSRWLLQGVRITLDRRDLPVIWEVLTDSSSTRLIFVSASLERAARLEFGAPLPGRRFALERRLQDWPDIAVVRELTDSPVPMGPWIYLVPGTLDVSTLLCRCMPSQVRSLVGQAEYELRSLGALAAGDFSPLLQGVPGGEAAADHALSEAPDWLERCLRLPASF